MSEVDRLLWTLGLGLHFLVRCFPIDKWKYRRSHECHHHHLYNEVRQGKKSHRQRESFDNPRWATKSSFFSRCYYSVFRLFYPFLPLMSIGAAGCKPVRVVFNERCKGRSLNFCACSSPFRILTDCVCVVVVIRRFLSEFLLLSRGIAKKAGQPQTNHEVFDRIFNDCGCESPRSVQARRVGIKTVLQTGSLSHWVPRWGFSVIFKYYHCDFSSVS